VNSIQLSHPDLASKQVEALGECEGVFKFMIDQNPCYVCNLKIAGKNISDIGQENWILRFRLHRLMTLSRRRLLRLKNTVHDEVLTKNLAVLVKHCDQCCIIHDLDEFGASKEGNNLEMEFGYNSSSDLLEIYLIVDNYFNRKYQHDPQRLLSNWMELMPISYGTIDISDITKEPHIGTQLQPVTVSSINLDKAINNLIIREPDIFALGHASFQQKAWGFLTLQLLNNTGLSLELKQGKEAVFLYYKVEVEDHERTVLASFTTEARVVEPQRDITFTNNAIEVFLIQRKQDSQFTLKITATLLESSNLYTLFEKRQDITDFLLKRGEAELNVQVKSSETNNLNSNSFQLTFSLRNEARRPPRVNLIARAQAINTVDALSFRDMTGLEFLDKLLGCENASHFNECLEEIKESFIYS
jgi:hypothetical protein